jgi:dihydrofolate synthase/folylpolyglutamate synthase
MEELDSPQDEFPSLHIAGSKGKGSVSAFCAAVYQTAGWKVGLYTSPHLKDFEERIQINREPISRKELVNLVEKIKPAVAKIPGLTTFEIMTGLAFCHFSNQEVDIAVIEVGLGGRLDATNLITPLVSVITSLYLDHTGILGDTIEEIAAEKGGIIKPGVPVVTAPQQKSALKVLENIAAEKSSRFFQVGKDFIFEKESSNLEGQVFRCGKDGENLNAPETRFYIPLLGKFQVINAVTAFAALEIAGQYGFPVSNQQIQDGFLNTEWPARFEIVRKNPPVVIDSAHNPASVQQLMDAVEQYFPGIPIVGVFGISEDKQLSGMYQALLPRLEALVCTQADHPRAMDAQRLLEEAGELSFPGEAYDQVPNALIRALELAGDQKLVVITGSIFVAATARIAWKELGLGE